MMGLLPKLLASARMVLDNRSNMEALRSTCRDVLTEARRLGVTLPRLEAASSLFETAPSA
jgi:2-dehydropantoate 2-reductase